MVNNGLQNTSQIAREEVVMAASEYDAGTRGRPFACNKEVKHQNWLHSRCSFITRKVALEHFVSK